MLVAAKVSYDNQTLTLYPSPRNHASMIVIFLSLKAVCALLTTFEFIIATLVLFSFRPVLRGLWLFKLHRRKMLQLQVVNKSHQAITQEAVGLLIGAWFALFVTLTEYRLDDGFFPISSKPEVTSRYCALMSGDYDSLVMINTPPPLHFLVDSRSLEIAELRSCPYGIDHLDFGTNADNSIHIDSVLIPKCVPQSRALDPTDIFELTFKVKLIGQTYFQVYYNLTYILSYATQSVGLSYRRNTDFIMEQLPPIEECIARNISSMSTVFESLWRTRDIDNFNMSRSLLQRLCGTMDENVKPLDANFLNNSNCFDYAKINTECLRAYIGSHSDSDAPSTYSVIFEDVSVLLAQEKTDSWNTSIESVWNTSIDSIVCVDASVRYEYVLLSYAAINLVGTTWATGVTYEDSNESHSYVLPLRVRVLSGSCERTMYALGLSALLYSTRVDWPTFREIQLKDKLKRLSRQQRLHAYMMSIARYEFPFYKLRRMDNLKHDCTFEMGTRGTKVRTDAVFVLLVVSLSICTIIIVTAAIFCIIIPKHAWEVAKFSQKVTTDDLDSLASSNRVEVRDGHGKKNVKESREDAVVEVTFKRNCQFVSYKQQATIEDMKIDSMVVTVESEAIIKTTNDGRNATRSYSLFEQSTFYSVQCFSSPPT